MGLGIWVWVYGSEHMGPGSKLMSNLIFMCLVSWDPRPKTQDPNPKTQDPDYRSRDPENVYAPIFQIIDTFSQNNI